MNDFVSTFEDGGIVATSRCDCTPTSIWSQYFDFGLVGASWDVRCAALTRCEDISFGTLLVVNPHDEDVESRQTMLLTQLTNWGASHSREVEILDGKDVELRDLFTKIRAAFWNTMNGSRKPARIFVDVTTCSRYLTLAFLREALFSGVVSEIVVGYSEGKYPDAAPSYGNMEEIAFHDGALQAIPVPGMYGEFEPSKEKFYMISVGFDGWRTLNLVVRKEPERVAILLCSPGVQPEYERRSLDANRALIDRYAIYDAQILRARAGDAVGAWRTLTEGALERFESENVFYMCAGNKPHSIALALRAMTQQSAALIYNCPTRHRPVQVEFADQFWAYSIKLSDGTVFG